jgi:hypothetical protein
MKKYILVAIVLLLAAAIIGFRNVFGSKNGQGFAVVELFTSEGCSSCPPADETVIDLSKKYKNNVFILGYHVDYWNNLGWKDVFSSSAYSSRQRQYAIAFGLNGVYTPQIIVDGKIEFVGSDKNKLLQTIMHELRTNSEIKFDLSASSNSKNEVIVELKTEMDAGNIINVALVQNQAESKIMKGENAGKQLHHINIVREMKTITAAVNESSVSFTLADGLRKDNCKVIAFVQNKKNLQILGAAQTSIH